MMNNIFAELRRRNVFRIAGVYAVVGWMLVQVAIALETALSLPGWFDAAITAALFIGFPIALILAWAFEMTPEGMKLTAAVPEGESIHAKTGKKLDYVIIGGLALVAVMIIADRLMPHSPVLDGGEVAANGAAQPTPVSNASIAVLPFADLSPQSDQEFFSDGIAEEILNVLVRVDSLKVASRTSAFGFKGQEALGIPLIAEKLNVRHILEGSVRKSGETVRITAQLIDAQTDQHLWSETYDRTLTAENLFAIQDEIANAIVKELGLVIEGGTNAPAVSVSADTQNLDAYEKFLEARALFTIRNNQNIPSIIDLFEQVVKDDPEFARGWAGLSAAYVVAPSWELSDRDYYTLAAQSARRAIDLNPELGLPFAVFAEIDRSKKPADFSGAFSNFDEALKRDPNEVNALQWRGESWVAVGFFDRAVADYTRCIEIDPAFLQCRMWLAKTKFFQGKVDEGFALHEKAIAMGGIGAGAFHYAMEYAHADDKRATALSLSAAFHQFSYFNGRSDTFIRALTDQEFDFNTEANAIEIEWKANNDSEFVWDGVIALIFKKYEFIKSAYYSLWWIRTDPEFLKSSERKRLIREAGVYDYWQEAGFPPQCKPIGKDDFECE